MYVKVIDGQAEIYYLYQLRIDYPETLFPDVLSDETLAWYSIYPVVPTTPPTVDYTQNVENGTPIFEDGQWFEVWVVTEATEQEKQQRLDGAWYALRAQVKYLLEQSDWTQLPDVDVDHAAWAVYRQQLRDLPDNTTDPFNPVWPVPPS